MKLLSINTVAENTNAPADIMLNISSEAYRHGFESMICYGRNCAELPSYLKGYKINSNLDVYAHTLLSRIGDSEGLHSGRATIRLINHIYEYAPNIIHMHNIHGHYLNYPLLFDFLKRCNIPIVWTMHDCWAYTGHCVYYSDAECSAWRYDCKRCRRQNSYPKSYLISKSERNFKLKKEYFTAVPNLHIVAVSDWLKNEIEQSFLSDYPIHRIYNGIDTETFKRVGNNKDSSDKDKIILGVASRWDTRKGLDDFIALATLLPEGYRLQIVGNVPEYAIRAAGKIEFIGKLSKAQLVGAYSNAAVFVNTSKEETFGMTTIEALSCGTPVIVNSLTALPEIANVYDNRYVQVVDTSRTEHLLKAIMQETVDDVPNLVRKELRQKTIDSFSLSIMNREYLKLYKSII